MRKHKGIGLAAPQVGVSKRVCICEFENEQLTLINPVITKQITKIESEEGCLSLPNILYNVSRFAQVAVSAFDENGQEFSVVADGMMSIIIQHEMDHLEGILITDKGYLVVQ